MGNRVQCDPPPVSSGFSSAGCQRPARVLVFDLGQSPALRSHLAEILQVHRLEGMKEIELSYASLGDKRTVQEIAQRLDPDLVFALLAETFDGCLAQSFQELRVGFAARPIVSVMANWSPLEICQLMRIGTSDFVSFPLNAAELWPRIARLLSRTWRDDTLLERLKERLGPKQIIGASRALRDELEKLPIIAGCEATVLICGETGTGKEACARAVHYLSARARQAFVPVNCGSLPADLIENEFFGHAAGAFTGAARNEIGLVQEADGGTLFLDEIDTLPAQAQVKLLRFLQEKEFRPLGGREAKRANVRLIAASNTNLAEAVRQGAFRRDLFYRLSVLSLTLPPLRDRREDISLLARHFIGKYAAEFDRPPVELSPGALQKLLLYSWPGNIRELENTIQRAVLLAKQGTIEALDLNISADATDRTNESFRQLKARSIAEFERSYLQTMLSLHAGNISAAARAAQKNRRAFWALLRKHRLLPSSTARPVSSLAPPE